MRSALRVITPPTFRGMTTVSSVLAELDNPDSSAYTRIPALILQATRVIERYVGREFARQQVEETFTWEPGDRGMCGYREMMLSRRPVISIDSMNVDGTLWTNYDTDLDMGLLYPTTYGRSVAITYTFGYIMPEDEDNRTLPEELERACIDTVLALWFRPERGDPMIRSDRVDGVGSTSYYDYVNTSSGGALPPSAIAILNDYRAAR